MPRVLATAAERNIDATSAAAWLQLACSLTNEDKANKAGSTMLANEPDRVHAKATTLGVDVSDVNALRHIAKCLQNVDNRWTGQWDGRLMEIAKYKKDHGHFPRIKDSPQLGRWLEKQRGLKRKLDKGEHAEGMTSERAAKLAALGCVWDPPKGGDAKWRRNTTQS
jgi:hypothetical protein